MNPLRHIGRMAPLAAGLVLLAACGTTAVAMQPGGATAPAQTPPAGLPAPPSAATPSQPPPPQHPAPTPRPPAPAAMPSHAPVAVPPHVSTMTFAIRPLFHGGAVGTVTATTSGGGVRYHVVVTGLAPGSSHTIHDHSGSCNAADQSLHLSVLTTSTANAAGVISFDTSVPNFEYGAGRIVIVYATASPALITGCAGL